MDVTTSWLNEYVDLAGLDRQALAERLMFAGLNLDGIDPVGPNDYRLNLEVTSNRPDCLGHIGIAREIAVLYGKQLKLPAAEPKEASTPVAQHVSVRIDCPKLCPRYSARLIRGVRIGPSPAWLVARLQAIGIAAINNVVDITNYVLMECGQPLHAFDFAKLAGGQIVVREPKPGEKLEAIDHKTYELSPGMCVIADRDRAVGLAGIMGGASSEVTGSTRDVLIEAAEFDTSAIRSAARKLNLHSDSSYRFERGVDPHGVDWACRRACQLILELAGGELAAGAIDVGRSPPQRETIVLRLAQIKRILGIEIPETRVREILAALGAQPSNKQTAGQVEVIPPSWRADLTREIDLIEEVARIHGYDAIPEDVRVPMATSARTHADRVLAKLRHGLTAAGFDEALTVSVVEEEWSQAFSPWSDAEPLRALTPVLRRADRLRRSLVPSLLGARRTNESLGNPTIELFETAKVYLPRAEELPSEELMLALTSGGDFLAVKGAVEALVALVNPQLELDVQPFADGLLDSQRACQLRLGDTLLGYLGEVSAAGLKRFDLRGKTTVAELRLAVLFERAELVPQYAKLSMFPAIARDLNLVVDEAVHWSELATVVRRNAGPLLESLAYQDTYRDEQRLGAGKKSLLFSVTFRDNDATFTSPQADQLRDTIVAACATTFGAQLRA